MQKMTAPTPDGGQMPVIAMVGQIIGSPTIGAGWLYHLFNSAVIGAIFGWLLGDRVHGYGPLWAGEPCTGSPGGSLAGSC